ncbi:hypothetical protein [Moraxella bovoculi]|nr:hypothetical protein [Moraxella bovoculi]
MTTKSLTEHGLIKTCLTLMGFLMLFVAFAFVWKLPEIILAIKA